MHVNLYEALKHTFGKREHLCSPHIISRLFERGSTSVSTFYLFPFRVLFIHDPEKTGIPPQLLFSISKKNFKRAVDRNLIRRRCREAYRLNKELLQKDGQSSPPSYIAFLYLAKETSSFDVIESAMKQCLLRMGKTPPAGSKPQ